MKDDVAGWLQPAINGDGTFLDLGCGAGMLLAASMGQGRSGIGIDVSMTWLVVAKRLVAEFGGEPILAAALGESLPLKHNSIDAVISLDVIEHVRDPGSYHRQIERVVRPGGRIALSTPNRFSDNRLAPSSLCHALFLMIGPFFRIIGEKPRLPAGLGSRG